MSPMQSAVKPNPVAAMLATTELSVLAFRALQRSLTRPVSGLACSQKKQQLRRSISSSNWSSSGENAEAGPEAGALAADCAKLRIDRLAGARAATPPRVFSNWRRD